MDLPNLAPDFAHLGPYFGLQIATRPADTEVVWLNERWWARQGVDAADPDQRRALKGAIRDLMGVTTHGAHSLAEPPFIADRYGGATGSYHGGSGRCASRGAFSGKGIGPTPLIPKVDSGNHRDGQVSFVEAVREAGSAEIADIELPYGAVPVVAILGYADKNLGEAIVVRPNFIRPAHFLRSIYFGTAGFPGSDQHLDGLRVAENVRLSKVDPKTIDFPGFATMIERLAHQVGAGHALRLWQGRFLPANASVTGALADFGSFRGVPSWHRYYGDPDEFFGEEVQGLLRANRALRTSFSKHVRSIVVPSDEQIVGAVDKGFKKAIRQALQLPADQDSEDLLRALRSYFSAQQLETGHIGYSETSDQKPWIHEALLNPSRLSSNRFRNERELLRDNRRALSKADVAHRFAAWAMPRPKLSYERPTEVLTRFLSGEKRTPAELEAKIDFAINRSIATSVRNWPRLPPGFQILGQTYESGSIAVYGVISGSDDMTVCVRGTKTNRFFGTRKSSLPSASTEAEWRLFKAPHDALRNGVQVTIDGVKVDIPAAKHLYPRIDGVE